LSVLELVLNVHSHTWVLLSFSLVLNSL